MNKYADKVANNKSEAMSHSLGNGLAAGNAMQLQDNRPHKSPLLDQQANGKFIQKKANKSGLPEQLKSGVENLSGHSLDDVKVHYNSGKPANLNAHAYAQGTQIHLAPGQEKHLPHEAWHIVQQKQGRVRPTVQTKGVAINDDKGLEHEADVMGKKSLNVPFQRMAKKESTISQQQLSAPIQLGGNKWAPHHERKLVEEIGEIGGGIVYLTMKDDTQFYVEAWTKKPYEYAGAVNIHVKGKGVVALHTTSDAGKAGGLSLLMFGQAIKLMGAGKFGAITKIEMTPAPGAASKKVIELLSEKFGDPVHHAAAKALRDTRIATNAPRAKGIGLNDWDPAVIPEHQGHLDALAAVDVPGLSVMSGGGYITGPEKADFPETPAAKIARINGGNKSGVEGGYGITLSGGAVVTILS
jgi:hypothetical protein